MAWIMRTEGHDVRDRFAIVFVAGSIVFEEFVEAPNPLRHGANRLQADRHATVGECVLDALLPRLRTKIAVIDPHLRQNGETPCALRAKLGTSACRQRGHGCWRSAQRD